MRRLKLTCNQCTAIKIGNDLPFCNLCLFEATAETRQAYLKAKDEIEKHKLFLKLRREIKKSLKTKREVENIDV